MSASSYSGEVDWIFYFILGVSAFFFVLICALMVLFVARYHAKPGDRAPGRTHHSFALEMSWTLIPLALVVIIFYYGFRGYIDMATPPANAYPIVVTAYKWGWSFQYPNGYVDDKLHIPAQRPISLVLQSQDVIHSLYIPAFRIKKDAVPGRYNKLWFQASESPTGDNVLEYDIYCAEYCGTGHSGMLSQVIVHEPTRFKAWLEDASNWVDKMAPAEAGAQLFKRRGCTQCHTTDGSALVGPTFKNAYGHKVTFKDGSSTIVDENYIRQSILDPGSQVVAGYDAVMPTYKGLLKDNEITALIEFIKTKSDKYQPAEVGSGGAESQPAATTQPAAATQPAGNAEGGT